MESISKEKTQSYREITIKKSFLIWSWTITYRLISDDIFIYTAPNTYKKIGVWEYLEIRPFFDIELN